MFEQLGLHWAGAERVEGAVRAHCGVFDKL